MLVAMKTPLVLFSFLLLAALGFWTYPHATGDTLNVCAKNDGDHYFIGDGFKRAVCKKNEKLISWDAEGPQGQQGEKGDKGDPATHGAGNIAFIFGDYLLKTDGTIWIAGSGNVPFSRIGGNLGQVPITVSDIVAWTRNSLIDKNGNYWYIYLGNSQGGWHNFGPLP